MTEGVYDDLHRRRFNATLLVHPDKSFNAGRTTGDGEVHHT